MLFGIPSSEISNLYIIGALGMDHPLTDEVVLEAQRP